MEDMERNISSEMREFELNMQINAVSRTIVLLGIDGVATVDEIVGALADAEVEAEYLCGFIELSKAQQEKKQLGYELVKRGLVTIEGRKIKLTDAGKDRAGVNLPTQIETTLRSFDGGRQLF